MYNIPPAWLAAPTASSDQLRPARHAPPPPGDVAKPLQFTPVWSLTSAHRPGSGSMVESVGRCAGWAQSSLGERPADPVPKAIPCDALRCPPWTMAPRTGPEEGVGWPPKCDTTYLVQRSPVLSPARVQNQAGRQADRARRPARAWRTGQCAGMNDGRPGGGGFSFPFLRKMGMWMWMWKWSGRAGERRGSRGCRSRSRSSQFPLRRDHLPQAAGMQAGRLAGSTRLRIGLCLR